MLSKDFLAGSGVVSPVEPLAMERLTETPEEARPPRLSPPSAAESADIPARPSELVSLLRAVGIIVLLLYSPVLLISGGGLLDSGMIWLEGQSGQPRRFDRSVYVTSPDEKTRFEAEIDGTLCLTDTATRQTLHRWYPSLEQYSAVESVDWVDNEHVKIRFAPRYPFLSESIPVGVWNVRTGAMQALNTYLRPSPTPTPSLSFFAQY